MKNVYNIVPYKSVGVLKFGMTQELVEEAIGKPIEVIRDNVLEQIREVRVDFILVFVRKRLVDVRFREKHLQNVEILINGVNILDVPNTIEYLSAQKKSKPSKEEKYCINFYGFGICLFGFGKRKLKDGRGISCFAKSRVEYYECVLIS